VEHFLDKHRFSPTSAPAKITEEALARLMEHDWPGNVRELENVIERAVVMAQGGVITSQHLILSPISERRFLDIQQEVRKQVPLRETLAKVEKQLIEEALEQASGNRAQAAKILGIPRRLLNSKIREFDISSPDLEAELEEEEAVS